MFHLNFYRSIVSRYVSCTHAYMHARTYRFTLTSHAHHGHITRSMSNDMLRPSLFCVTRLLDINGRNGRHARHIFDFRVKITIDIFRELAEVDRTHIHTVRNVKINIIEQNACLVKSVSFLFFSFFAYNKKIFQEI